jgi:hypothetical protein
MGAGMSDRVIPARDGIEVFLNESGTISIKQEDSMGHDEPCIVVVHPDDVDALVSFLQDVKQEAHDAGAV